MSSSFATTPKTDLYERITARIVDDLSNGTRPWLKPWTATAPEPLARPTRCNGEPYQGINVLLLWSEAAARGYASPSWMTYRQALELGGQVRRGEAGTGIVYASAYEKTKTTEAGVEEERSIPFLKAYTVFNADQVDGLPERFNKTATALPQPLAINKTAEHFFLNTGAVIRHGGDRAYYAPGPDVIQLPQPGAFQTADGYLSTKAHELVHWTGHRGRLNRQFGQRFGDHAYAFEELVAEIGAAFICADLGVCATVREDHAAYIANWLTVLKDDKRAVFTAAAHAQRAAVFLHTLQQAAEPLAA